MTPDEELPPLTLHIGTQTFISTNYGWIDNDFYFDTEDGQTIRCKGMYPTALRWEGLEREYTDEATIVLRKQYSDAD